MSLFTVLSILSLHMLLEYNPCCMGISVSMVSTLMPYYFSELTTNQHLSCLLLVWWQSLHTCVTWVLSLGLCRWFTWTLL